ncbi:MAG: glycosyltransferase family 4 protein [Desulfurococcaceae archaeon]
MIKNILIIIPTYWPEGSGGTLATHLIIKHLSQTGRFDITVLTGTRNPEVVPGVRYVVDPFVRFVEKRFSIPRLVKERYGKLIEKHDVIYTVYAYPFIPVAKKLGKRVIVHLHDYRPVSPSSVILANQAENPTLKLALDSFKVKWFERKDSKSLFLNIGEVVRTPLIAKWVNEADTVIAVSRRHAELLVKLLPSLKDKLVVIYNPPPPVPRIRKELAGTPTFLYVGGESFIKGFHVLMQAIETALREGVKARFIFTNRYGNQAQRIISTINKNYGNVIYLTGRIPYTKVLNLYRQTWALLFPSIWEEPLPYAPIESVLLQTIPIASKVGGIPELLSPFIDDTLLVKPGDVKALQERIIRLSSLQKGELHDQIVYLSDVGEYLLDKLHESSKSLSLIIAGE